MFSCGGVNPKTNAYFYMHACAAVLFMSMFMVTVDLLSCRCTVYTYHRVFLAHTVVKSDMVQFDDEVTEKIGREARDKILDAVTRDLITEQKMEDIAQSLQPKAIGGNHTKRKKEKSCASDGVDMRNILSDWWEYGDLGDITRERDISPERE